MDHWEADKIINYNLLEIYEPQIKSFLGKYLIEKGILFQILTPLYIILLCN